MLSLSALFFNLCLSGWEGVIHFHVSHVFGSSNLTSLLDTLSLGTFLGPLVPQHCASGSRGVPDSESGPQ